MKNTALHKNLSAALILGMLLSSTGIASGPTIDDSANTTQSYEKSFQDAKVALALRIETNNLSISPYTEQSNYKSKMLDAIHIVANPQWSAKVLFSGAGIQTCLSQGSALGASRILCNPGMFLNANPELRLQILQSQYENIAGVQSQAEIEVDNAATQDREKVGNGGDTNCDKKFQETRDNLLFWLNNGENLEQLTLPNGVHITQYKEKMRDAIQALPMPTWTDQKLVLFGQEKTCANGIDATGHAKLLCNYDRFQKTNGAELIQLVHHEYAGLAGFEENLGIDSDYSITRQLANWTEVIELVRLGVKLHNLTAAPACLAAYNLRIQTDSAKYKSVRNLETVSAIAFGLGGIVGSIAGIVSSTAYRDHNYPVTKSPADYIAAGGFITAIGGIVGLLFTTGPSHDFYFDIYEFQTVVNLYSPWFDADGIINADANKFYSKILDLLRYSKVNQLPTPQAVAEIFYSNFENGGFCPDGKMMNNDQAEEKVAQDYLRTLMK